MRFSFSLIQTQPKKTKNKKQKNKNTQLPDTDIKYFGRN